MKLKTLIETYETNNSYLWNQLVFSTISALRPQLAAQNSWLGLSARSDHKFRRKRSVYRA